MTNSYMDTMDTVKTEDLFRACRVLFGSDIDVSVEFLSYLQVSGVKSAFRKRAFETHPDTEILREAPAQAAEGGDGFIEAQWAYEMLNNFVSARVTVHPAKRKAPPQGHGHVRNHRPCGDGPFVRRPRVRRRAYRAGRTVHQGGHFHSGKLPLRTLMFGEYLFYAQRVSWESLIKAIVWQRRQRPRFGQIAGRWGLLRESDIWHALSRRKMGEPLGKCLVRLGFITESQLAALLFRQRSMQKPIGGYFVSSGLLNTAELDELLSRFNEHNLSVK